MIWIAVALAAALFIAICLIPTRETLAEEERQLRDYFRRIDGE